MKTVIAILVAGFVSQSSFAEGKKEGNHPCKNIVSACEAAGFKKGGHKEKKGLWKDCVEPIKSGQSVEGVTVSAEDLEGCKAKREKHAERKAKREAKRAEKKNEASAPEASAPESEVKH
jgi:hypothetical protein